jgi:alpha-ribazole phosphatase
MQPWENIPRADIDAWVEAFPNYCFGGKECVQDILDRVAEALTDATLSESPEMVWVTHAGVIRAVQFLSTEEKRTKISLANEWPSSSPSMGEWICLEIPK